MKKIFTISTLLILFQGLSISVFSRTADFRRFSSSEVQDKFKKLIEDVESGSPEIRLKSIQQCGWWRVYPCYRALLRGMEDLDSRIRKESANSLGLLALPESAPLMETALKNEKDITVQLAIIFALGNSGNKDSAKTLTAQFESKDEKIRRQAILALSYLNVPDAVPAVKKALETETVEYIKPLYLKVILLFERENTKYTDMLIGLLGAANPLTRYYAANTIFELKIKEANIPVVKAMALEEYDYVKQRLYDAYQASLYAD